MTDTEIPKLSREIRRDTMLNLAGRAVPLLLGLFAVPLLVKGLGLPRFGILALVWSITLYFAAFDVGLGRGTTKSISAALQAGEKDRISSIAWASLAGQVFVGVPLATVVVAAVPFLVGKLIPPGELVGEATAAFTLAGLGIPILLASAALRGFLEGFRRFGLVNSVRAISSSANFLLPLLGVALDLTLGQIVLLLQVGQLVTLLALYVIARRVWPGMGSFPRSLGGELSRLFRFGAWVTLSSLLSPVLLYLDRFVLASSVTVGAVALYAAPYEGITRLSLIPVSLISALFPVLSALHSAKSEGIRELSHRALSSVVLVVGALVFLAVFLARDILLIWLGPEFAAESTTALRILAVGVFANSLSYVPYTLLQASDRADLPAKFHLLETPLHVLSTLMLVWAFGLIGAAISWSLRVGLDSVLLFAGATRVTRSSLRSLLPLNLAALMFGVIGLAWVGGELMSGITSMGMRLGLEAAVSLPILIAVLYQMVRLERGLPRSHVPFAGGRNG